MQVVKRVILGKPQKNDDKANKSTQYGMAIRRVVDFCRTVAKNKQGEEAVFF